MPRVVKVLSSALVQAGYTSMDHIRTADPRQLEAAAGKAMHWGNSMVKWCQNIPDYRVNVRRLGTKCKEAEEELEIEVCLQNMETISAASNYYDSRWYLLIGAQAGNIVISTITRSDSLLVPSWPELQARAIMI